MKWKDHSIRELYNSDGFQRDLLGMVWSQDNLELWVEVLGLRVLEEEDHNLVLEDVEDLSLEADNLVWYLAWMVSVEEGKCQKYLQVIHVLLQWF